MPRFEVIVTATADLTERWVIDVDDADIPSADEPGAWLDLLNGDGMVSVENAAVDNERDREVYEINELPEGGA